MAKYKFLSETETEDDKVHQYIIEVTVDLGDKDVRKYQQDVVFKVKDLEKNAQEYADSLESDLKKQKEDGTLAPVEESAE